ncbi:MAG: hypothetical protein ACXWQO_05360 [Bdellovibrionota bacterium]
MNTSKYTFQENGFHFQGEAGQEKAYSFTETLKVRFLPYRRCIVIKSKTASQSLAGFDGSSQKAFLHELFERWLKINPEAARKAAFDYAEDRRGFCRLVLAVCLLFTGPMAVALLNDSWKQASCTAMLQKNIQTASIAVTKVKKEKKGQYILKLAFSAPNGRTIMGEERWITENENEIPKTLPIIYSPEQPECWAMTTTGTEISWAKRRYFSTVAGLFGIFFLLITLYGLIWSIGRLIWLPPYREEIKELTRI